MIAEGSGELTVHRVAGRPSYHRRPEDLLPTFLIRREVVVA